MVQICSTCNEKYSSRAEGGGGGGQLPQPTYKGFSSVNPEKV